MGSGRARRRALRYGEAGQARGQWPDAKDATGRRRGLALAEPQFFD